MTKGDLDKALACAQAAQKQLRTDPQVLHTLGLAYLRRGDLEESVKNLRVAVELRPGDPTMLLDFGLLLIAQKHPEEGKKQVEMALRYATQLGLDFPRRAEAENVFLSH